MMPYLNLLKELAETFDVALRNGMTGGWVVELKFKGEEKIAYLQGGQTPEQAIRRAYLAVNPPKNLPSITT